MQPKIPSKKMKARILHNIEDFEDGTELELLLDDQPILENGRLIEEDTALINPQLQKKNRRNPYSSDSFFNEGQVDGVSSWNDDNCRGGGFTVELEDDESVVAVSRTKRDLEILKVADKLNAKKHQDEASVPTSKLEIQKQANEFDENNRFSFPIRRNKKSSGDPFAFLKESDEAYQITEPSKMSGTKKVGDVHDELRRKLKPKITIRGDVNLQNDGRDLIDFRSQQRGEQLVANEFSGALSEQNEGMIDFDAIRHVDKDREDEEDKVIVHSRLGSSVRELLAGRKEATKSAAHLKLPSELILEMSRKDFDDHLQAQMTALPNRIFDEPEVQEDFGKSTAAAIAHLKRRGLLTTGRKADGIVAEATDSEALALENNLQQPRPKIKIEYRDKKGRLLTPKEAFKQMSWKFHGTRPKITKMLKNEKKEREAYNQRARSDGDNTLQRLLRINQKVSNQPFMQLN